MDDIFFFPGYKWTYSEKDSINRDSGGPSAPLHLGPPGSVQLTSPQLRGRLLRPPHAILMDSFGGTTITKDSSYYMQSVVVKMEAERRKSCPSSESDDEKIAGLWGSGPEQGGRRGWGASGKCGIPGRGAGILQAWCSSKPPDPPPPPSNPRLIAFCSSRFQAFLKMML